MSSRGEWGENAPSSPFVQSAGGGDAYYVELSRQISQNIGRIEATATSLLHPLQNNPSNSIAAQLDEARRLGLTTQRLLRDLENLSSEAPSVLERSQRDLTRHNLKDSFNNALRQLDAASEESLQVHFHPSTSPPAALGPLGYSYPQQPYQMGLGWFGSARSPWSKSLIDERYQNSVDRCQRDSVASTSASSQLELEEGLRRGLRQSNVPGGNISPLKPLASSATQLRSHLLDERSQGIQQIHRDLQGLNELYHELSSTTHQQGSALDAIENQLEQSVDSTSQATDNLMWAQRHYNSGWRRRILCLILLLVVIVCALATFHVL